MPKIMSFTVPKILLSRRTQSPAEADRIPVRDAQEKEARAVAEFNRKRGEQ